MFRCEYLLVSFLIVASAAEWPELYDNQFKRWSMERRSLPCKMSEGKCYSTGDCCPGYVCAALEGKGLSPTVPGHCLHEKDLTPCKDYLDCSEGSRCLHLDGTGMSHRYCVPIPEKLQALEALVESGSLAASVNDFGLKPLGESCEDSSDCSPLTPDGTAKVCCQKIRQGRMGTKKRCEKIIPISVCMNSPDA